MDGDDRDDMCGMPSSLDSCRQEILFNIKSFIGRARFAKFFPSQSSTCWFCSVPQAEFIYILRDCVAIQQFLLQICLLGLVDSLTPKKKVTHTLLSLFNYARKIIDLSWKNLWLRHLPAKHWWTKLILFISLPFLYKATYKKVHKRAQTPSALPTKPFIKNAQQCYTCKMGIKSNSDEGVLSPKTQNIFHCVASDESCIRWNAHLTCWSCSLDKLDFIPILGVWGQFTKAYCML